MRESDRKRRIALPERIKNWRDANPEKVYASALNWRVANAEKRCADNRKWQVANPEKIQLIQHRRRARIKANGVFLVTVKEVKRLLAQPCYLCGVAPSTASDHIIPISRGGRQAIGNLLGVCKPCNSRKGTMLLVEFNRYLRNRVAA